MDSISLDQPPPLPKHRPVLVWVISIFYGFSIFPVLVSYAFVFSKSLPATPAQREYFSSLTVIDHAVTALVLLLNVAGAILLFRLKKAAPVVFSAAFALGVATVAYHCFTRNWFTTVGIPGLISTVVGWCINLAIVVYAFRLRRKRVLS